MQIIVLPGFARFFLQLKAFGRFIQRHRRDPTSNGARHKRDIRAMAHPLRARNRSSAADQSRVGKQQPPTHVRERRSHCGSEL